jgi:hypothetical protein
MLYELYLAISFSLCHRAGTVTIDYHLNKFLNNYTVFTIKDMDLTGLGE